MSAKSDKHKPGRPKEARTSRMLGPMEDQLDNIGKMHHDFENSTTQAAP